MQPAPLPANEADRLAALQSYEILDTAGEAAFDELTGLAARLLGVPMAAISLLDADRQWFKSRIGLEIRETGREESFCGHAILGDAPFVVPDASADARFADNPLVTGDAHVRFYAGAPLVNAEGHALGTLCVLDRAPRTLTAEQRETLAALARAAMTTLELRRVTARLRDMALIDSLTGLPNRRAMVDALGYAMLRLAQGGEPFALLMLDLDGFRRINLAHGHMVGDEALRVAGAAVRGAVRRGDIAARFGGDVFALLVAASAQADLAVIARRLRAAVERDLGKCGWDVTASVGAIAVRVPPRDLTHVLSLADQQLALARRAEGERIAIADYAG